MEEKSKNLVEKIASAIAPAVPPITEIGRLMPDSILFGSFLLYILTHNLAYGALAIFMLESSLTHKLISTIYELIYGKASPDKKQGQCIAGYKTPRLAVERILMHDKYPSLATYSIVATATYLTSAMTYYKDTLKAMGPEWAVRYNAALAMGWLFTIVFILVRLWSGCDSLIEILFAAVLGVAVGLAFYAINKGIFDKESMNFLGLPYLIRKDEAGNPIFVCAPVPK
jgi:hypothetical protein